MVYYNTITILYRGNADAVLALRTGQHQQQVIAPIIPG